MKKLVQVKNLVKTFNNQVVLKGISLDIEENEFVTLLGPSGCGKTTLLRIIAGFLDPDEGHVLIDGQDIAGIPAYKRDINTVFQRYALFPHLDVYNNIAFGLQIKKEPKDIIDQKVRRMISLVGLEGFEHRDVSLMSGGQQQRVAIARALVNEPKVLLLDEPLSALDKNLRKEMQLELKQIQQEVGITFIFVTHDQEEALTMSDKIVIMKDGEIEQIGTPTEVYNEPINEYCARFIGDSNIMDGIMKKDYLVHFDDNDYECVDHGFHDNEPVDVVIRPEDIDIVERNRGLLNGEVKSVLFKGVHYEVIAETSSGTSKTVTLHVTGEHDVVNEEAHERISASGFTMDIEDVPSLTTSEAITRANAQAWNDDDDYVSLTKVSYDVKEEVGTYHCTFATEKGTSITVNIHVVRPAAVEDKEHEEAIQAFDFYKTVEEIKESVALDTDLIRWADAAAWNLEDDSRVEIWDVKYDFDDENIKEGDYQVTFSTQGRELKIETTDHIREGQRIGLRWNPEDIHVMRKMV
ncbi:MAG: ABC transporter ATP-binding protein [Solobacterium sp.]|nr:ABC transporter ATP-binding protein [Solobacterium sp.]MBQ1321295.1 ABC transporter ATP-binding protein [Solobacterium sp.]MBQ6357016.1 ABC transporter ATP-binding protein [Solobacterium sp.]MBQ6532493.1 ABC transporter ATP-binding protein [Solobacterium sp.]